VFPYNESQGKYLKKNSWIPNLFVAAT
jgi:hypothetical protein